MADIRIVLIPNDDKQSADAGWAKQLAPQLQAEIDARNPAIPPVVEVTAGFANIPSVEELGPLSLVALVLPDNSRGFLRAEKEKIAAFQQSRSRGDIRVVPLSRDQSRDVPPAPLNGIVSQKIHDPVQRADLERLATFLLNLVGLRLGGAQRKLFISYRTKDGLDAAAHLASALKDRGYEVWRDELKDRDGQPFIGPGTEAQETIEKAILDHGFVLVIDSPEASQSTWVHAEIDTAYAHMLPLLPVVIEDGVNTAGQANIPIGGRFNVLREMQRQVRVTVADQTGKTIQQVMNAAWLDRLEKAMSEVLLGHLRSRLSLIREAKNKFEGLNFRWNDVSPPHLLFEALLDWNRTQTPRLTLRLLVQCAPYDVIQEDQVINLMGHLAEANDYCQYGILVHPVATNPADKYRLLRQSRGHLLLFTPGEIGALPQLFKV